MNNDDWVMDGLEEAYRDGLVDIERPADPDDGAAFSLSEHGEAYSRDLLRENETALLYVLALAIKDADNIPKALAEISIEIGKDTGVNPYRVIQENEDMVPWLKDGAITDDMVAAMEVEINE